MLGKPPFNLDTVAMELMETYAYAGCQYVQAYGCRAIAGIAKDGTLLCHAPARTAVVGCSRRVNRPHLRPGEHRKRLFAAKGPSAYATVIAALTNNASVAVVQQFGVEALANIARDGKQSMAGHGRACDQGWPVLGRSLRRTPISHAVPWPTRFARRTVAHPFRALTHCSAP